MREVLVELLREELFRLSGLLTQTRVLHACGEKLHGSGEVLTTLHLKAMNEAGIRSVFLLEPGEMEAACARALSVEMVATSSLKEGDVVMEDLLAGDGSVLVPAGATIDPRWLPRAQSHRGHAAVLKRGLDTLEAQARQYLARAPMAPPKGPRPDTRLTQVSVAKTLPIRSLMVPRAKVFVCLRDALARSMVAHTLAGEGHEAAEFADPKGMMDSLAGRPDVVILDAADGQMYGSKIREVPLLRTSAILVAAPEGKGPEVYRALMAGANGSLALPARRELVMDGVRAAMKVMGKSLRVKPVVQAERRRVARENVQFACRIVDKFLSKPLPVATASVADIHEAGARIEYPRPEWPSPWAYVPGSMHPKHFFFNYARVNPLGREITLAFTSPGGAAMEVQATFVHMSSSGVFEVAGLLFQHARGSVKEHMTTMRAKPAASTRRF